MTVTKAQLDALRSMRPAHNAELHLRPDDHTVAYVHSSVEAERIGQLNHGDRVMQYSSENLREDLKSIRHDGYAKAQFNQQTKQQTQQQGRIQM